MVLLSHCSADTLSKLSVLFDACFNLVTGLL